MRTHVYKPVISCFWQVSDHVKFWCAYNYVAGKGLTRFNKLFKSVWFFMCIENVWWGYLAGFWVKNCNVEASTSTFSIFWTLTLNQNIIYTYFCKILTRLHLYNINFRLFSYIILTFSKFLPNILNIYSFPFILFINFHPFSFFPFVILPKFYLLSNILRNLLLNVFYIYLNFKIFI